MPHNKTLAEQGYAERKKRDASIKSSGSTDAAGKANARKKKEARPDLNRTSVTKRNLERTSVTKKKETAVAKPTHQKVKKSASAKPEARFIPVGKGRSKKKAISPSGMADDQSSATKNRSAAKKRKSKK